MCSESTPKEFEKTTEVLPFTNHGLSSMQEFKEAENYIHHLEWLSKAGLNPDEIKIYQENEAGLLDQQKKVEANAMKEKLDAVYSKIKLAEMKCSEVDDPKPKLDATKFLNKVRNSMEFYPEGHPMNQIKEIEVDLFGHLHDEDLPSISRRRKMLRRFERKKAHSMLVNVATRGLAIRTSVGDRPLEDQKGFTWSNMDKEVPKNEDWPDRPAYILNTDLPTRHWDEHSPTPRNRNDHHPGEKHFNERPDQRHHNYLQCPRKRDQGIGPKNRQMYTIRDNNIVRLERNPGGDGEYRAVDIVVPENQAEEQLLEGTKMSVDNIKKIERFRNYEPGVPSKSLYLKNIAPTVTEEQVTLLFNQFVLANGGPIPVRLMKSGRMRGQAFVEFQDEEVCVQALSETNGTIMSGQPIIAQFARTTPDLPPPG